MSIFSEEEKNLMNIYFKESPRKLQRGYPFLMDEEILLMIKREISQGKKVSQIAEILNDIYEKTGDDKYKCAPQTLKRQLKELEIVDSPVTNKEKKLQSISEKILEKEKQLKSLNKLIEEKKRELSELEGNEE